MLLPRALLVLLPVVFLCSCADFQPVQGTPEARGWSGAAADDWNRARSRESEELVRGH